MSEWQPTETAPKDGSFVRLKFADGKTIRASFEGGLLDSDENYCGGWMAPDGDAPPCWTDGICWEVMSTTRSPLSPPTGNRCQPLP